MKKSAKISEATIYLQLIFLFSVNFNSFFFFHLTGCACPVDRVIPQNQLPVSTIHQILCLKHISIFSGVNFQLSAVSDPDCRESHRKIPCQKEEGWKDVEANEGKGGRIQTTGERGIGGRGVWREAVMLSESLGG